MVSTCRTKELRPMAYSLSALILRLRHLLMFSSSLSSASILMRMASCEDDPCNELENPILVYTETLRNYQDELLLVNKKLS